EDEPRGEQDVRVEHGAVPTTGHPRDDQRRVWSDARVRRVRSATARGEGSDMGAVAHRIARQRLGRVASSELVEIVGAEDRALAGPGAAKLRFQLGMTARGGPREIDPPGDPRLTAGVAQIGVREID